MRLDSRFVLIFPAALAIAGCGGNVRVPASATAAIAAIRMPAQAVDESRTVTLVGNVHPLTRVAVDEGAVSSAMPLERMVLVLKPSAEQQAELDELVAEQQDPQSAQYHKWLTPEEYGARFGAGDAALGQAAGWLESHGFAVEEIAAGRRVIVFSGTVGETASAFHTEMHRYRAQGEEHLANAGDPRIPAELADTVAGVVSLHDFRRSAELRASADLARPEYSAGSTHYIFPADFAAIYDLNPLYAAGTKGSGSAIAIAGRSNIQLSDVESFRSMAGLTANDPAVIVAGSDPGLVANDRLEATLDAEWSGAVAPEARVSLVVAASTATTDGIDLAATYIVNHAVAPVVSVSYGSCEQQMGAAELAFYNALWEQAASEGMSVFVSSGDAGAAGCNAGKDSSGTRAAVNGLCSSPYATCVGGTEFDEGANAAKYWSTGNGTGYESALGYIPERVWNESAANGGAGLWATGGGASRVYAQPEWQKGVNAANGMRAVPDVALASAAHDGTFMVEGGSYQIVSGTSVAAPAFAGVMALVVESQKGAAQGNANPRLYALAESTASPFHATPAGDNSVPGVAGFTASGETYNLATGLGSVDGALLVKNWSANAVAPTLTVSAGLSSAMVAQGGSTAIALTVTTGGSFTGNVSLSVIGAPAGVTAAWTANPIVPAASATQVDLTLTAAQSTNPGSYSLNVTAAGDGLTAQQGVTLLVEAKADTCIRVGLHPARCRPPVRTPIRFLAPVAHTGEVRGDEFNPLIE